MLRTGPGKGKGYLKVTTIIHLLRCHCLSHPCSPPSLSLALPSLLAPRAALSCGNSPSTLRVLRTQIAAGWRGHHWLLRRLGSRLGAWAPGPARCLSTTSEVPDAEWLGLGSRGLFVPLWQMVLVGSRRNRPKIVPATQTFRRHQCTPLCNNTNFVAAEKSIFPP